MQIKSFPDRRTVTGLLAIRHRQEILLFIATFVVVLSLAPLLTLSGIQLGLSLMLAGLAAFLTGLCIIRWPVAGFFLVLTCAVLVEQEPITPSPPLTNYLYVFYWPPSMAGAIERPIGFLILFIFFIFFCHRLARREPLLRGGALIWPFLFYMLCVVGGAIHGLTSGGSLKIVVLEVRPFWYMFTSYLLAYNLITQKKHIRAMFWIIIIGAGIKGLQGVYIYLVLLHGNLDGHREIMAHEESFFFVAVLLLIVLFCIHYRDRAQLYTALFVTPPIVIAMIANQRRTDYIALLIGILVAWFLIFLVKPRLRTRLIVGLVICTLILGAYIALFYQTAGSFAAPARSIVSIFRPDPTSSDYSSDLYRVIEDYDLKYTVKLNPLGLGFGKPFLQPLALPNILDLDPYYQYIPHNTIYWVWMRLGIVGFCALWYLFGSIIINGCFTVRRLRDPYLQMVAIYIVAVVVMEVVVAYADYQLYFYRNVIYVGLLTGVLLKLPILDLKESLDTGKEHATHEDSHAINLPTTANMGSRHA